MESIRFYQSRGYGMINDLLRENYVNENIFSESNMRSEPNLRHILNIDSVISRSGSRLNDYEFVYRGMSKCNNFENGDTFAERAYMSTSTDLDTSIRFSGEGGCVIKIITSVKSITSPLKAFYIKGSENEVLIERGSELFDFHLEGLIKGSDIKLYTAYIRKWAQPTEKQILEMEKAYTAARRDLPLDDYIMSDDSE